MVQRGVGRPTPIRPVGVRADDVAVTDVLGSLLLVGITVAVTVGFGVILLSFDGPADKLYVDVEVRTTPGADGLWETGDESFEVLHLGGEALRKDRTTIAYTADGTPYSYTGDALGSYFDDDGDGRLTIGEAWESPAADPLDVSQDEAVEASIVADEEDSQLVAAGTVTGGGIDLTVTSCLPDLTAPSGAFSQSPSNVNSLTSSLQAVQVTLTVSDLCTGVDESSTPVFAYCIAVTCTVPTSFTTAVMADGGTGIWTFTIPAQNWLVEGIAGKSIQYYATTMRDLAGNTAQTSVAVDAIDLVVTYYYVNGATATTGAVAAIENAQATSASDSVVADLAEGAVSGSPTTVGPTKYPGTTVANSGALNPNNVLASDESRAEFDTSGDFLELTGIDLPAGAASVDSVAIGVEGRKASSGGTSPALRLDYKLGAGGTYSTGTPQTISTTTDTDYTRTLSGSFSVAQVESLYVRVLYAADTNRNPQVDTVFVTVTYTSTPQTEYRMDIQLEWAGVPATGLSTSLELRYRVQDDTFTVEVQHSITLAWRACTGTLAATSLTTFTCALQSNEVSALGDVMVRVRDVTQTGTTQGHLYLDHARVGVA